MSKTKVLYIVDSLFIGGVEKVVTSVCNDLDKYLFEVNLLVLSNNEDGLKSVLSPEINIIELNSAHSRSGTKDFVRLFCLKMQIKKIITEINPDVIHTHSYFYAVAPVFMAIKASGLKIKHFHTIHTAGLHYSLPSANLKIKYERKWYKKLSTTVVCVSKEVQRNIQRLIPGVKNVIISNYVDIDQFRSIVVINDFSLLDTIKIAYTARLASGKNHRTLIEAIKIVAESYPNVELWLIGDGDLKQQLIQQCQDLGVTENVKFLGLSTEVPTLLQKCNIGVFPSEFEGFSVALLEMLALSLPVVCSNIDTLREFSLSDNDILYFETLNSADCASKIMTVIENDELRQFMYSNSGKIAQIYSKQEIIKLYNELYLV